MFFFILIGLIYCEECLNNVFLSSNQDCEQLTELQKGKIAFEMMNCHYARNSKKTIPCNSELHDCTSGLDGHYWSTFTQFYVLVQNYCQIIILQSLNDGVSQQLENIRTQSGQIIDQLFESIEQTEEVSKTQMELEKRLRDMFDLVQGQKNKLSQQQKEDQEKQDLLMKSLELLNEQVEQYRSSMVESFDELLEYYKTIQYVIQLVFDQTLQIREVLVYLLLFVLFHFITSNRILIEQRLYGVGLLILGYYTQHLSFWITPTIILFISLKLCHRYQSYKDYEKMAYEKMMSIQKNLNVLQTTAIQDRIQRALNSAVREAKEQVQK